MNDVMIDLETLGTRPGCVILSIGAVFFNPNLAEEHALGQEFYRVVSRQSCLDAGLFEDAATVRWWREQTSEARQVLIDAEGENSLLLSVALSGLAGFLSQHEGGLENVRVWGNGSDFDNAILAACYSAVNCELPWKFWNNRCYRTLKAIKPGPKPVRIGTYHNALDDARTQAMHAVQLLKY